MGSKCRNSNYNEDGYDDDYDLIPVLHFMHYVAKWEWMYESLVKYMWLKFIVVDESWPYHVFKKEMLRSRNTGSVNVFVIFLKFTSKSLNDLSCDDCEKF